MIRVFRTARPLKSARLGTSSLRSASFSGGRAGDETPHITLKGAAPWAASSFEATSAAEIQQARDDYLYGPQKSRRSYASIGIEHPALLSALHSQELRTATRAQVAAAAPLLRGEDVVLGAETGSGKTLGYLLPLLQTLLQSDKGPTSVEAVQTGSSSHQNYSLHCPRIVVLVPNKELAAQVHAVAERLLRGTTYTAGTELWQQQVPQQGCSTARSNSDSSISSSSSNSSSNSSTSLSSLIPGELELAAAEASSTSTPTSTLTSTLTSAGVDVLACTPGTLRKSLAALCSHRHGSSSSSGGEAYEAYDYDCDYDEYSECTDSSSSGISSSGFSSSGISSSGGNRGVPLLQLRHLVLDEADLLLEGSYAREVTAVLAALKTQHRSQARNAAAAEAVSAESAAVNINASAAAAMPQTVLVAATIPTYGTRSFEQTVSKKFPRCVHVRSDHLHRHHPQISQCMVRVNSTDLLSSERVSLVVEALRVGEPTLVFANTAKAAEALARRLRYEGVACAEFHKNLSNTEKREDLAAFRSAQVPVLVCTDAAARGLDLPHVRHVVQAEFALNVVQYLHRVGRCSRAGVAGRATNLHDHRSALLLQAIEDGDGAGAAFSRRRGMRSKVKQQARGGKSDK